MKELKQREWRRLVQTIHGGHCVLVLDPDVVFDPASTVRRSLTSWLTEPLAGKLPEASTHPYELPSFAQLYLVSQSDFLRSCRVFFGNSEGKGCWRCS